MSKIYGIPVATPLNPEKKKCKPPLVCLVCFENRLAEGSVVSRSVNDMSRPPEIGEAFATLCENKFYTTFRVIYAVGNKYQAQVISSTEIKTGGCDAVIKSADGEIAVGSLSFTHGSVETIAEKMTSGYMPVVVLDVTADEDGNGIRGVVMTAISARLVNTNTVEIMFANRSAMFNVRATTSGGVVSVTKAIIEWQSA